MNILRKPLAVIVLTLFVSVFATAPASAAPNMQGTALELVQEGSGFEIVIPHFKELKEVSFLDMEGERQSQATIVMGAPEPDSEGRYPLMQVVVAHDSVHYADVRIGTYQDGELSLLEGELEEGRFTFNPAIVGVEDLLTFADNKVFIVELNFYDADKNIVFSVKDINLIFVDLKEIPVEARPSSAKVTVDGQQIAFEAYNMYGNNYFKLRDIAKVLNGTSKQFEVGWDPEVKAIELQRNVPYTADGSEMQISGDLSKRTANPTQATIYIDGVEVALTAYNIGGYNYFMLRDLARGIDFNVTWDNDNKTIGIDTSSGYVEP